MEIFPDNTVRDIGGAVLRSLALIYVLFGILLFLRQDAYLFYPPVTPMEKCAEFPDAEIVVAQGTRAYHLKAGSSTKMAVIYHGNAERACDSAYLAVWLTHYGYDILAVEYAGYSGDTARKPSVRLLMRDTEHISAWVKEKGYSELLIIGRSIGAGFASYHASLASPQKLLLISPFDKLSQLAKAHYPIYPISLLLKTELDNIENAAYANEVLIIHGAVDDVIPIGRGRTLFDNLPQEKKAFISVEGVGHNDVLGTDESWSAMVSFMQ